MSNISDRDLIELGSVATYKEPEKNHHITINGNEYDVIKTSFGEYESGLDYAVYENIKTGERVLAFQGSSETIDWTEANIVTGGDETPQQYEDANEVYNELIRDGDIDYVVGNSFGGGLALYVDLQNDDVTSVVLNPSPPPECLNIDNLEAEIEDGKI